MLLNEPPSAAEDGTRGRAARRPRELPRRGWRDVLLRVFHRIGEDNVTLISAGIAFNAMFAVFPALILLVSIYGMFASPASVEMHLRHFMSVMPHGAAQLLESQLKGIAARANGTLDVGAAVSLVVTLWSSIQGSSALITATNIAYHEPERRGYFALLGLALLFTFGALLGFILLLALGVAVPFVVHVLPLGPITRLVALAVRWVLLWSFAALLLSAVYRFAPCRENARWSWVSWGSVIASTLWLAASVLFALYVQSIANYGKIYGALGAVMVLLMWFYIGSFASVLGAELDAELEHQTALDTTTGPPEPMGRRGAYMADTLGTIPRRRSESPKSANPSSGR
ncbi:MAG: YihY/virulence factor BrkB family protein [Steroidobacteraceae bacterium]